MNLSKFSAPGAFMAAAFALLFASGCSHGDPENTPKGGPADAVMGAKNAASQGAAYQERMNHDPLAHQNTNFTGGGGQNAGQAAAMQARQAAQGHR